MNNLKGKVCIVTGSTSGIGLATAKELSKMGVTVVLVARNMERGELALAEVLAYSKNENTDLMLCDFSVQSSIVAFTETFKRKYNQLDILVNNAGMMSDKRIETEEGIEQTFAVNHLGYFITTSLLLDVLKNTPNSRIVVVSSDLHHRSNMTINNLIHKYNYDGFTAYSDSKLANLLFTYKLANILQDSDTTINAVHPGVIKTKFSIEDRNSTETFPFGKMSPENGAKPLIYLCVSSEVNGVSGKYFNEMQMEQSSVLSYNEELAHELWQNSIDYSSML